MIYEDALASVRRHVAAAFKAGTSTFPHYTLHGEEHLAELDRLALLFGSAIPALSKERLDLLRLAIILHDFAMVDVPDPAREEGLRQQMGPGLSFADIVRKTHQDEIDRSFTQPQRIAFLQGLLPRRAPRSWTMQPPSPVTTVSTLYPRRPTTSATSAR